VELYPQEIEEMIDCKYYKGNKVDSVEGVRLLQSVVKLYA